MSHLSAKLQWTSITCLTISLSWQFEVRPEFTGTLAIKSGRHPILETVQAAGMLVPNDVYCDDASSFQVIQGPKSVYFLFIGEHRHLTIEQHVRKKYVSQTNRPADSYGHVWIFCPCRVCQFPVSQKAFSCIKMRLISWQSPRLPADTIVEWWRPWEKLEYLCQRDDHISYDSRHGYANVARPSWWTGSRNIP